MKDVSKNVKIAKQVFKEAAKLFGRSEKDITISQFTYVSRGRVPYRFYELIGGFSSLRSYLFPSTKADDSSIEAMKKLIKLLGEKK